MLQNSFRSGRIRRDANPPARLQMRNEKVLPFSEGEEGPAIAEIEKCGLHPVRYLPRIAPAVICGEQDMALFAREGFCSHTESPRSLSGITSGGDTSP